MNARRPRAFACMSDARIRIIKVVSAVPPHLASAQSAAETPGPAAPNPLQVLHRKIDAEFQRYANVEIVCTFGEPQAEYSAIHKGCALMDLPQRGILEVSGKDRQDLLNRLLTNQIVDKETKQGLLAGQGCYAFLLNNKGRIIADMNVLELGDRTLLETELRLVPVLEAEIGRYIFSEKVRLTSRIGELHQIALQGPRALGILREMSEGFGELTAMGSVATRLLDTDVIVWRDDPAGVPGYFLILPIHRTNEVWLKLIERFGTNDPQAVQTSKRKVWPSGWAAFNAARVEAGRAMFGIDFDSTVLPAETGELERAVSFTKGCYVGQEIVARMHARGQSPRLMVGIKMELDALPIAGAAVFDMEHNRIGQITSSTISPILSNAAICLAMVKKQFAAVGTELLVGAEGAIRKGFVAHLPFLHRPAGNGTDV
jgi:folate-binding protein YgfZ